MAHAVAGSLLLHGPTQIPSPCAMAMGTHNQLFFLTTTYLMELDMTSGLPLKREEVTTHGKAAVACLTKRCLLMWASDVTVSGL